MDASLVKTIVVFVIIFGCFAVLYPRLFYPVLVSFMGSTSRIPANADVDSPSGHHRGMNSIERKGMSGKDNEIYSRMKMTGHPGMHALSEMKKYSSQKQSSDGKGILGIVLPLYALGIVVYLLYTLSRLFLHKKNNTTKSSLNFAKSGSYRDLESNVREKVLGKQKELEKLLWKADQEDIGVEEISLLKKRLIETENQMTRILKAMDAIQKTMSPANCHDYLQVNQKDELKNEYFFQNEIFLGKEYLHTEESGSIAPNNNMVSLEMANLRRRTNTLKED